MSKVILKRSSVSGKVPQAADLDYGELAINYADGIAYFKRSDNTIGTIGGGSAFSQAQSYVYTATENQTSFACNYDYGRVYVYLNGVKQILGTDYIANTGTSIDFLTGLVSGDLVDIVSYSGSNDIPPLPTTDIVGIDDEQTLTNKTIEYSQNNIVGVQPLNYDLTSIAELNGISGLLRKINTNSWALDTNTYITGNELISITGDVSGSGTTSINLSLSDTGVSSGTYGSNTNIPQITIDAKGRITSVTNVAVSIPSGSLSFTGDITGTGLTGSSTSLTLANVGSSGTYTKVTTDSKGRVISGNTLSASDIPSLDAAKITSGILDAARLPSYVDDVLEYSTLASFPVTGETGKIYVDLTTNKTYRWSGSTYVYITSGAVDSVAGKTGVVTLVKGDVGLGSVENTALSTWTGSANITTLGTITTGTWSGTAIALNKLAASTISGVTLGNNLNTLTLNVSGTGLSGSTTYNGSTASTFTVTSNATSINTASTIVARDASGKTAVTTLELGGGVLYRSGGTAPAYYMSQDGTGRQHWYWNTVGGTSPVFSVANEGATDIMMHADNAGNEYFLFRAANGTTATAGSTISWESVLYASRSGTFQFKGNTVWHAGNDGTGSGLDADLLDGQHATYYTNASNLASGIVPAARLGSGTASASTYLRGDNTWAPVSGGVSKPEAFFMASF